MAQAMVNFRMDAELKMAMESVCRNMGLSMTAAFTVFATKVVHEQRIPFEICCDPFYSAENMAHLRTVIADAKEGRNMEFHDLIEVD